VERARKLLGSKHFGTMARELHRARGKVDEHARHLAESKEADDVCLWHDTLHDYYLDDERGWSFGDWFGN
jgi:hypothetical protein